MKKILRLASTDPYENLAFEDTLFRSLSPHEEYLLLWSNDPSVVMGRFQNPWIELDLKAVHENKINLVRRQSGGGTVYHDLGNLNFTYMARLETYLQSFMVDFLLRFFSDLGITIRAGKNSSLFIGDKKISGSAFKQTKDSRFHHGTLLVHTDLSRLNNLLTITKKNRINSRGTLSIPSNVMNLVEVQPDLTREKLTDLMITKLIANDWQLEETPSLDLYKAREHLQNEGWIMGETPKFSLEFGSHIAVFKGENLVEIEGTRALDQLIGEKIKKIASDLSSRGDLNDIEILFKSQIIDLLLF